ncbi:MAG: GNAT family N-acetyltransferase [Candidatus Thiodiazotropha sp. (ex Lucina pensylvanica)]|nr:GNAT family N-acetyltransferase [Candidatus Thiodiazotropha sp. (ex Lucina pensylvanica)]MBT3016793.1 GNAT family N-acetyltransferase [Candidatus Thiodiazotropha taylori]MBT3039942.1 GNAT family N-acetyltransferase [Candidatus Thiodiazotropha sp. (ex Codakia orbicularis)]MBT3044811.1 GNAT family N-acetyltransferase [Candidatus Thiodiazotropha sp. (ex Codakia orbicularis)]
MNTEKSSVLETDRLILRQWRDEDYMPFARINADPRVMEFFPQPLSRIESDDLAKRCRDLIDGRGWGFWAVELRGRGEFIGIVGLNKPQHRLPCSPCVEIGWRLSYAHWGMGYATEAGSTVLRFAFEVLDLNEVVAFTTVMNKRSREVMQRIGMLNTQRDFDHPALGIGHPLSRHVLYSISGGGWKERENKQ